MPQVVATPSSHTALSTTVQLMQLEEKMRQTAVAASTAGAAPAASGMDNHAVAPEDAAGAVEAETDGTLLSGEAPTGEGRSDGLDLMELG